MKIRNLIPFAAAIAAFSLSACNLSQAEASATYVAAEVGTTALLQKNPKLVPVVTALVADWPKLQAGTLTPADETALLQSIVAATKGNLNPTQAALLDGATQQILANQNTTAPTPIGGAAAAIVTDVINGAARAVAIYTPPTG